MRFPEGFLGEMPPPKENYCQFAFYLDRRNNLYYNNPQGFTWFEENYIFTEFTVLADLAARPRKRPMPRSAVRTSG